ncbi:MAG: rhizobactin siderophore biosynthesis protein RhsF [Alteromonadaceae bacterium]|nr:rhizobactin siderophore biosynthesis protein RhsF [Alteromonadaceae bacterium]|tara:strand:- start:152 stop:1981 length:1830 start_codon:yes stop_codon:yes gene_type:complete
MKWPDALASSERLNPGARILRQLIEALLSEGLLTPLRHLVGTRWQILEFDIGATRYSCRARVGGFGRIRLEPGSLRSVPAPTEGTGAAQQWQQILATVAPAAELGRLQHELQQTLMLCQWNQRFLGVPQPRRTCSYSTLESALDEGHPYHPCFKARSGFSLSDHRNFGPECGQTFSLVWVAVRRDHLRQTLPRAEAEFWQRELGEEHWFRLRAGFNRLGLDWAEHAVLPVHPWQWQKLSGGPLAAAVDHGVHYLGCFGDRFRATQSLRTLFNVSRPDASAVKLPMDLINTSSPRTLAPHSVVTAPALSAWLKRITAADAFFASQARLVILAEYAGMIFQPEPDSALRHLDGHLGALWRENPESFLLPGERATPLNAVMATESDGRPFINDWIHNHGLQRWLDQFLHCAVLPVWHLLAAHGIALEAHAQNMVLFHRDGWPTAVALRDFHESVEYVDDFLARPDECPDFGAIDPVYRGTATDRFFRMSSVEALRELVMDSLFVFNLAELANLLDTNYGLPEDTFWRVVRKLLDDYARRGYATSHRLARIGHEENTVRSEALFTRKLMPDEGRELHHIVPNALVTRERPAETSARVKHLHPTPGRSEHALRQ